MESHPGQAVLASNVAGMFEVTFLTVGRVETLPVFFTPICPKMAAFPMLSHLALCPAVQVVFLSFTY